MSGRTFYCGAVFLKYTDGSWHLAGKKWTAPYLWSMIGGMTTDEIKEFIASKGFRYQWV